LIRRFIISTVSLCSSVCKAGCDHFKKRTFVDADLPAAGTCNFVAIHLLIVYLFDAIFVAAQYFTLAYLVIAPDFFAAAAALNNQHGRNSVFI